MGRWLKVEEYHPLAIPISLHTRMELSSHGKLRAGGGTEEEERE
jgi:hypothetical protein